MKYFIMCSPDQPTNGEWSEFAEWRVSENKEEIEKEFQNAIVDGEYPYVLTGVIQAEATATMEITTYEE